jgi:hypothetical protein
MPCNSDVVHPSRWATKISFAAMDNYVRNSPFDRHSSKPMRCIPLPRPTTCRERRHAESPVETLFHWKVSVFHDRGLFQMTAEIIQFVPKPNRDRSVQDSTKGWTLQPDLTWKKNEIIPFGGAGIDGMTFTAPDSDPA